MKINDIVKKPVTLDTDKVTSSPDKKADKASVSSPAQETVTLSPMASQMKALETKVANVEVFDAKKVESIKSAISSGKFNVDSEKIADGLIASVRDFLSAKYS
jgi:negative regulator of flagellin synthesis FlgM